MKKFAEVNTTRLGRSSAKERWWRRPRVDSSLLRNPDGVNQGRTVANQHPRAKLCHPSEASDRSTGYPPVEQRPPHDDSRLGGYFVWQRLLPSNPPPSRAHQCVKERPTVEESSHVHLQMTFCAPHQRRDLCCYWDPTQRDEAPFVTSVLRWPTLCVSHSPNGQPWRGPVKRGGGAVRQNPASSTDEGCSFDPQTARALKDGDAGGANPFTDSETRWMKK